jgi:hypothetical protein
VRDRSTVTIATVAALFRGGRFEKSLLASELLE